MGDASEFDGLFVRGDDLSAEGVRFLQAGDSEAGLARFHDAIAAYEESLDSVPEAERVVSANLRLCIGARRYGLGEIDAALEIFDEVEAEIGSRDDLATNEEAAQTLAQARLNRADCLLARDQTLEAKAIIDAVLTTHPDHPYAQYLSDRCQK